MRENCFFDKIILVEVKADGISQNTFHLRRYTSGLAVLLLVVLTNCYMASGK